MALPQAINIRISMLRLVPQCFAFTSDIHNIKEKSNSIHIKIMILMVGRVPVSSRASQKVLYLPEPSSCLPITSSTNWRQVRRRSHYGENDGDGDVTFRCSHFTFRTVTITVSLPCRERRRGYGCHGDGDGDGSRRCYFSCV